MILIGLAALILLVLVMRSPAVRILAVALLLYAAYQAETRHDQEAAAASQK